MTQPAAPPDAPHCDVAWPDIRARYEAGEERVDAIARSIGMARITLSMKALKEGWKMRGVKVVKAKVKTKSKPADSDKPPSTRETIQRLKEMLQQRVTQLEQELRDLGTEVNALSNERGIRSVNMLVRTSDHDHRCRGQCHRRRIGPVEVFQDGFDIGTTHLDLWRRVHGRHFRP
ncbi:MAG: hypothetical protein GYA66_15345 [Phyllobacteriaceae bacterium]|nr:hypothetical protein [Phyllobacteriaceae bacterium]